MAAGDHDAMQRHEEIVGSDSAVALSILRRKGATRRTKHVELKAFFLQNYVQQDHVKTIKIATEAMLADSLTKVMTMPESHVAKCGLKSFSARLGGRALVSAALCIAQVSVLWKHGQRLRKSRESLLRTKLRQ